MEYKIRVYQSTDIDTLIKDNISETWICRVVKGGATLLFDQTKCHFTSNTVFVVPEGVLFRALSTTSHIKIEVLVFGESQMNIVYTLLGAENDVGTLEQSFWSNRNLGEPFGRLIEMDYESLTIALQEPFLKVRHKMITSSLTHLLLTIYTAVNQSSDKSLTQTDSNHRPRLILNRYFEMVSEQVPKGERRIRSYAEKLCVTERYLYKICIKETGQTPKEILNTFLISAIKNAILTTGMSLQQIADQYHFPDQSAFGQYFKRHEGVSPSEFRRSYS